MRSTSSKLAEPSRSRAEIGRREAFVTKNMLVGPYRFLEIKDKEGPAPKPGQFYMIASKENWGTQSEGRPYLPRPMSAWSANDHTLGFLFEVVGPGSKRMEALIDGDCVYLTGPLGRGFSLGKDTRTDEKALLISGGVGIVPIIAFERELLTREIEHQVLAGFRTDVQAESASLLVNRPLLALDDGGDNADLDGPVTDLLEKELNRQIGEVSVYACGPSPMLEAVRTICSNRDIGAQLALETTMACGYGACNGCAVETTKGYIRLCMDGPVVNSDDLERVP